MKWRTMILCQLFPTLETWLFWVLMPNVLCISFHALNFLLRLEHWFEISWLAMKNNMSHKLEPFLNSFRIVKNFTGAETTLFELLTAATNQIVEKSHFSTFLSFLSTASRHHEVVALQSWSIFSILMSSQLNFSL